MLLLMLRNMLMLFMSEVGILSQWGGNGMVLVRVVQASLLASPLVDIDLLLMVYLSNIFTRIAILAGISRFTGIPPKWNSTDENDNDCTMN